jgi:hypothetical protein
MTDSMEYWYQGFLHRHPDLSLRICQNVKKVRLTAQEDEARIAHYYTLLERYRHLPPEQVYAADETGLDGDGARRSKVVAVKGLKRPSQQQDSYREHTSLMHIGNAVGQSHPLIFIFKGKNKLDMDIVDTLPSTALVGVQEKGYFMGDHFINVLMHLNKYAVTARPLLFVIDGATAHLGEEAAQYALDHQIEILCMPSNLTHLLQVADVSLFRPFKQYWKSACKALKWQRTRCGEERSIKKTDIGPLVLKAWEAAMTPANVISGFRRAGIYPFDPLAYKKSHLKYEEDVTGMPLLLTPPSKALSQSCVLSSIVVALPLHAPPAPPPNTPCNTCGLTPRKHTLKRKLSTKNGVILTCEASQEQFRKIREEKEELERQKAERQREKVEKKRKREEEEEEKRKRREERAVKMAATVAVKQRRAEEKAAVRAAKAPGASIGTATVVTAVTDQENRNPNTERPLVILVSVDPPSLSSPAIPPLSSPPPPPPCPIVPVTAPTHQHGTRHATRVRDALPR